MPRLNKLKIALPLLLLLTVSSPVSAQDRRPVQELRELWRFRDYSLASARGRELQKQFPADYDVRIWTLMNDAVGESFIEADTAITHLLADKHLTPRQRDFLAGFYQTTYGPLVRGTTTSTRKLLAVHPRDPDFVWLQATAIERTRHHASAIAFADSMLPHFSTSLDLLLIKAEAMVSQYRSAAIKDTTQIPAIMAVYDNAQKLTTSLSPAYLKARALSGLDRDDEAFPILKQLVTKLPTSHSIRETLLSVIPSLSVPAEQKKAMLDSAVDDLLATFPSDAWVLETAIDAGARTTAWRGQTRQTILDRFPRSAEAQRLRLAFITTYGDSVTKKLVPDTLAGLNEYRGRLRDVIASSNQPSALATGHAWADLYITYYNRETELSNDELVQMSEKMLELVPYYPDIVGITLPRLLADRQLRPDLAEKMVDAKVQRMIADVDDRKTVGMFQSEGEYVLALSLNEAMRHDVLGWIHYNAGQRAQGEKEIAKALDESPKYIWSLYHMGRISELNGNTAEARRLYTRGLAGERPTGPRPNQTALARLHIAAGGSPATLEAFLDSARAQERDTRHAAILAERVKTPKALPPFALDKLDGGTLASAQTKGKVTVINFWGTWCGPCVAEAGDIQKFNDRHKGDDDVVFLTVDNDADVATVRDFMTKRHLTFPVLLDAKKYIGVTAPVQGFPTTWFVGSDGNIAFTHTGASDQLLEEFEWRLDALRAPAATSPPTADQAGNTSFAELPVLPNDTALSKLGYLPPHDELPYLVRNIDLTPEEKAKIEAVRREYRPQFMEIIRQVKDPTNKGPGPLFARSDLEDKERTAARSALQPEHRKAFDDAVVQMVAKRQSMIHVQGGN